MSYRDIYDIAARLDQIAEGDLNQGAGPKFVGYLKGTDPASKTRRRLVGDSAKDTSLARKMSQIEKEKNKELDETVESLYQQLQEKKIGEDIVVKGNAKDLKDFLGAMSKEKKDTDLKAKDSNRGGDSLKPVDRVTIGPNGEKTAHICGNMDDGFVVKVDEKEIGSGFATIDDAKQAIDAVHEQMMEQSVESAEPMEITPSTQPINPDYLEER